MKMMGGGGGGGGISAPPSSGQDVFVPLQKASKTWKSFDWAGKATQWGVTTSENKESRELSQTARKHLADTTKSFKRAVKNVETSGKALGSTQTEENVAAALKSIESVSKLARTTVKSYQGELIIEFACYVVFEEFGVDAVRSEKLSRCYKVRIYRVYAFSV